jgi:hypothetical protein
MEARLQAALSIARATSGHVSCLHITPISLYIASDGITGAYMMPNFLTTLDEMEKRMRGVSKSISKTRMCLGIMNMSMVTQRRKSLPGLRWQTWS